MDFRVEGRVVGKPEVATDQSAGRSGARYGYEKVDWVDRLTDYEFTRESNNHD